MTRWGLPLFDLTPSGTIALRMTRFNRGQARWLCASLVGGQHASALPRSRVGASETDVSTYLIAPEPRQSVTIGLRDLPKWVYSHSLVG